ncbi:hypothetical protein ACSBR1_043166 [Camellia fascicularis]
MSQEGVVNISILTSSKKTVIKNMEGLIPEEGWKDEGNSQQVGRSTISCQLHDAEQRHATTVYVAGHVDARGQD